MGMSTTIVGFRPPDETWQKMKAIWMACEKAGITVDLMPEQVAKFFDHDSPRDKPGCEVSLGEAVEDWQGPEAHGYQVDVTKLPKDVRFIRFYNSW